MGAIPLILDLLQEHGMNNAEVAVHGAGAIRNLIIDQPTNRTMAIHGKALPLLSKLFSAWKGNKRVQDQISGAIGYLEDGGDGVH